MTDMPLGKEPPNYTYPTRTLSNRKPTRFAWKPNAKERAAMARALDVQSIELLTLIGEIKPEGRHDFRLDAELIADLTQSCVITLAPVPAKIKEKVERRFVRGWEEPDAEEFEITADDISEPMPEVIEIREVAREALSLALPPYPRALNAEFTEVVHAEPGTEAIRDDDLRPFAALAGLFKTAKEGEGKE